MTFSAISFCVPIASIVTIQPFISSISSSLGIAVISLLFSSHANCPMTSPHSCENALTTCSGRLVLSRVLRAVFSSIAITPVKSDTTFFIHSQKRMCNF